jgi:cellulose synthase (UDP-forming)
MTDLFPGLLGYTLFLLGIFLIAPLLPWKMPFVRGVAAGLAVFFNIRYLLWRVFETLPQAGLSPAYIWGGAVLTAELIAVVQISLHTILFIRLSDRSPEADDHEMDLLARVSLPTIDVFIPTVNEGWDILERSIEAAMNLSWDREKLKVWVLDDGDRHWLAERCATDGVGYIRRDGNKGYKAGNINNGLARTYGEFILSLDADFVVYKNYLERTVGFMSDPKIGLVQTPGNLTNPDPIQYNLLGEAAWPEEQRVFTDIVQPARDVWDNAFCYGGSFLVRRSALEVIGGIPEDSITEDLYSSYLLRAHGYTVRYLNESLSEGLAAESLASFIRQRCRWALGTLQCLYLKGGPLRARGLSLMDRIFFLDPVFFYLSYFWPFLILTAPAVYWWTGIPPLNAEVGHLLTMMVPRMAINMIVLYWLTGRRVVPIVSELGRIVGIFYLVPAVVRGLLDPFGHSFRVTLKGETRDEYVIQWAAMRGFLILLGITISGMLLNLSPYGIRWLIWDTNTPQVLAFTIFDFWLIFLAMLICVERPSDSTRFYRAATIGNFPRALWALTRRIFG